MKASLAAALAAILAGSPGGAAAQAAPGAPSRAAPETDAPPSGPGGPGLPATAPPSTPPPPRAVPGSAPAPGPADPGSSPAPPAAALPPSSPAGPAPTSPGSAPVAGGLPASPPAAGGPPCRPDLFRIRRSTNANEIVYAAQVDEAGRLDEDDPLVAYWLMHAEDGHREGLNILEKMLAYGFSADPAPEGGFRVVLKAKKDRPVHLALRNGCPAALIEIAGRPALLRSIYVQTSSGGVIPTVAHVDVSGVDPSSGREVTERILPN